MSRTARYELNSARLRITTVRDWHNPRKNVALRPASAAVRRRAALFVYAVYASGARPAREARSRPRRDLKAIGVYGLTMFAMDRDLI